MQQMLNTTVKRYLSTSLAGKVFRLPYGRNIFYLWIWSIHGHYNNATYGMQDDENRCAKNPQLRLLCQRQNQPRNGRVGGVYSALSQELLYNVYFIYLTLPYLIAPWWYATRHHYLRETYGLHRDPCNNQVPRSGSNLVLYLSWEEPGGGGEGGGS